MRSTSQLQLTSAEIQIGLAESFAFKGFTEPMPVYRIEQRNRTRIIADTYILFSDLGGFARIMDAGPASATVERILDALETVTHGAAREFGGTVRFNQGDSYCVTFTEAGQAIAGEERLTRSWDAIRHQEKFGCPISIGLHRGTLYAFRSFLYGRDVWIASRVQSDSAKLLASGESGVFLTRSVCNALYGTPWHNRLQPVALPDPARAQADRAGALAAIDPQTGIKVYRLCNSALD